MKKSIQYLVMLVGVLVSIVSWSQMTLPPSGNNQKSEVSQYMGMVKVTLVYNSPDVAGREIWGKLVPYGLTNLNFGKSTEQNPSPWRAGANENTTITFSHDVEVEGKPLKAGVYGLHMIPGQEEWIIIFTGNSSSWGSYFYTPADEVLRVSTKAVPSEHNEFLTFDFSDRQQNSCTARLQWEKLAVPFKISVKNGDELYVKRLREEMSGQKGFAWQNVVSAANFCAGRKLNLDEAYGWVQSLIDRNTKYYPIYQSKANILTAMDKKAEADATMTEAIALPDAAVAQINAYGRSLISQKRNQEAMTVFQANLKRYPKEAAAMLGMARGYSALGDSKNALKFAQNALKAETNVASKTTIEGMVKKLESGEPIN